MANSAPAPVETDFTPALDAAQNQLGLTFSASDALDSKALAISGFALAIAIFALQSEMHATLWLRLPFFVMMLLAVIWSGMVIWPRNYIGVVDVTQHPEYLQLDKDALVLQLLSDTQRAVHINTQVNNRKTRYCTLAIATTLIGIGLLVGCIL